MFKEAVSFCKELIKLSSLEAIPYFIIDVFNPLMPGGNQNVTRTSTNPDLKAAGLFKGHTYFNKPAVERFLLPPGIKGLNKKHEDFTNPYLEIDRKNE